MSEPSDFWRGVQEEDSTGDPFANPDACLRLIRPLICALVTGLVPSWRRPEAMPTHAAVEEAVRAEVRRAFEAGHRAGFDAGYKARERDDSGGAATAPAQDTTDDSVH